MALLSCPRPGVCGPSAATAPLAPCAEIAPGPFEINKPIRICNGRASASRRLFAGHCQEGQIRHGPRLEPLVARDAAERTALMLSAGNGSADHHAVKP